MGIASVLIIDEDYILLQKISSVLEIGGYDVIVAESGSIGIMKSQEQYPDLILCSVSMNKIDGFGVLSVLKEFPNYSDIEFVFLHKEVKISDIRRAMNLGPDGHIIYPFDDAELLNLLDVRIKKRKARHAQCKKRNETLIKDEFFYNLEDPILLLDQKKIKIKQIVYYEREFPIGIYYILSGKIKTFMTDEYGRELITGVYSNKEYFGISSFFLSEAYKESAIAIEASKIIFISANKIEEIVLKNPTVLKKFMNDLAKNTIEKEGLLLDTAYASVRKRVASSILRLYYKLNERDQSKIEISRKDLSCLVGIASETLSRILSDFKTEAIINLESNGIVVLRPDILLSIKN